MAAATEKNGLYHMTTGVRKEAPLQLIWLHGWGQDHRAFLPLAGLFEQEAENRLYDLPGFGASALPSMDAGSADYADVVAHDLGSCGAKRRILIGHSFGCRIAIQLAAKFPDMIDGLILISAAGIPRTRSIFWKIKAWFLRLLGKTARLADRLLNISLGDAYSQRFGSADYRNAGPLRPVFVRVINEDLTQISRGVRMPGLLIYGEDDTETPVEVGEKFADCIPYATLKILPGYGHNDILGRGKHQCESLIRKFLIREFGDEHA